MALDKNVPLVTNTIAEDLIAINANWEAIVSDTAYNATTWDAVTDVAPSKNAVRDKIEAMLAGLNAPTGTIMLFGQASAPTGWTKKINWQDKAMFTYNGDANGTVLDSGGSAAAQTAHTHTGPSHAHTGPSHTHTGPSHTHSGPSHNHQWYDFIASYNPQTFNSGGTGIEWAGPITGTFTGPYMVSAAAGVGPNADAYTNNAGTGATGAGGTGATGAEGTGATGAEGTGATGANTAFFYQELIVCTKD